MIVVATLVGLALRLLQLTRGHLLGVTEYDDGVYFGSAIRLINGVMPYRDFVLVQPPAVVLLMTPVAALSKVVGTAWGMGIARLLTVAAGTASVPLAGLLVRRWGPVATVIACGVTAVYPDAILASHTLLLEPWLVLFCLLGLVAVVDGDRFTGSSARLAWGGAALGVAGAVKLWAIFPAVVLAVMLAPQLRRLAVWLGGVVVGFAVPVLPFVIAAPSSFWKGVVLAQLVRTDDGRTPLATRLADLTGLSSSQGNGHVPGAVGALVAVVIIAIAGGACVWASLTTRQLPPPLEWFALITAGLVFLSFLWPADFYYHYAAFLTPFLALALALPVARLVTARQDRQAPAPGAAGSRLAAAVGGVAVVVLLVVTGVQAHAEVTEHWASQHAAVAKVIPSGACVLTDQVSFTIAINRFTSSVPGCPQIVDGDGTDLDLSEGHNGASGAAHNPAVQAVWMSAFRHAQYVWLSSGDFTGTAARRIAWSPALEHYFTAHFAPVHGYPLLYKRTTG